MDGWIRTTDPDNWAGAMLIVVAMAGAASMAVKAIDAARILISFIKPSFPGHKKSA
jgi:hypothetical protein